MLRKITLNQCLIINLEENNAIYHMNYNIKKICVYWVAAKVLTSGGIIQKQQDWGNASLFRILIMFSFLTTIQNNLAEMLNHRVLM